MITPAEVNAKYALLEPYLAPLQHQVRMTLSAFCEAKGFALVSRVKTLDSLCEKIESGRFANWAEINDLVAFAIVIPTLIEETPVVTFLTAQFEKVDLRLRGTSQKAPDVFRFDSTRFIGRLRTPQDAPNERPIDKIQFEIQVRSAFDHAWIVTTHALTYKTPVIDWKQQRLAAELKATAEQMDLLILAFQEASKKIPESPWPLIKAKNQIHGFFAEAAEQKQFPSELLPKDWSRFTDNVYDLVRRSRRDLTPEQIVEEIIKAVTAELSALGYENVPRSLSLWQFTLASLVRRGTIKGQMNKYWPLITKDLETLYPDLKTLNPRFDLSAG